MKIDTRKIVPRSSHTDVSVQIEELQNSLRVLWKNKRHGKHPLPVVIPKKILVDENTLALMGFFLGDGLKSNKGTSSRTMSFTNSEPETIMWAMRIFKIFRVPKKKIRASVSVRGNKNVQEIKKFWNSVTDIPIDKISVTVRPSLSRGVRNLPEIKKYGAIKIEVYSAILRDITIGLLNFSKIAALKNKRNSKAFLKGLLAAEGCPVINHGKLRNVVISCCDENNKRLIKQLCRQYRFIHKARKDGVELHLNNFIRNKNIDIFEFHSERNERFLNALKLSA